MNVFRGTAGIYKIVCKKTNKEYYGLSKNMLVAKRYHLNKLRQGKHWNIKLQRDYNSYGEDSFEFEVVIETNYPHLLLNGYETLLESVEKKYRLN
jgi:hypothetical protein